MPVRVTWELRCDSCGTDGVHVVRDWPPNDKQVQRSDWTSVHRMGAAKPEAWLCPECGLVYGAFWPVSAES